VDYAVLIEQAERRRRTAISLFVAATFGMAAILSLPGVRLPPFPFRLGPADVQGPPAPEQDPFLTDSPPRFEPDRLGRARAHASGGPVSDGVRPGDPKPRPDVPGKDDGPSPVPVDEPVPGVVFEKDKVPQPPSTTQQSTGNRSRSVDASTQEPSDSVGVKDKTQEKTLRDP
jgi:hypothetical protein